MKKLLSFLLVLGLLMLSSCALVDEPDKAHEIMEDEVAEDPQDDKEELGETDPLEELELTSYIFKDASFDVPSTWKVDEELDDRVTFYPEKGYLQISYEVTGPSLVNSSSMVTYFEARDLDLEDYEFVSLLRYSLEGQNAYKSVGMIDFEKENTEIVNYYFYHDKGVLEVTYVMKPKNAQLAENLIKNMMLIKRDVEEEDFINYLKEMYKPSFETDDGIIKLSSRDFSAEYLRHEFGTDSYGEPALLYYYSFTNRGKEEIYVHNFFLYANQNGLPLEPALLLATDVPEAGNYQKIVKPGATVQVCQAFKLVNQSQVELVGGSIRAYDHMDFQIIEQD